jgi:hypothetical protein
MTAVQVAGAAITLASFETGVRPGSNTGQTGSDPQQER